MFIFHILFIFSLCQYYLLPQQFLILILYFVSLKICFYNHEACLISSQSLPLSSGVPNITVSSIMSVILLLLLSLCLVAINIFVIDLHSWDGMKWLLLLDSTQIFQCLLAFTTITLLTDGILLLSIWKFLGTLKQLVKLSHSHYRLVIPRFLSLPSSMETVHPKSVTCQC